MIVMSSRHLGRIGAAIERIARNRQGAQERRPVVVVSAMGKTTNKLLALPPPPLPGTGENRSARSRTARYPFARGACDQPRPARRARSHPRRALPGTHRAGEGLAVLGELTPRSIDAISSYASGSRASSSRWRSSTSG